MGTTGSRPRPQSANASSASRRSARSAHSAHSASSNGSLSTKSKASRGGKRRVQHVRRKKSVVSPEMEEQLRAQPCKRNLCVLEVSNPVVAHFLPSTFPMKPLVEPRDIDICHFSFEAIKNGSAPGMEDREGRSGTVYMFDHFYRALYARCPAFRAYFKGSLRKRAQLMTRILDFVVTLPADDPEALAESFKQLGRVHRDRNIRPWMYSVFCETVIQSILHCLGSWADYRVSAAWTQVFGAILVGMLPDAIEGNVIESEFAGRFHGDPDPQQVLTVRPDVSRWRRLRAVLARNHELLDTWEAAKKGVTVYDLARDRTADSSPPPLPQQTKAAEDVRHIFYGVKSSGVSESSRSRVTKHYGRKKRGRGGGSRGGGSSRGSSRGRAAGFSVRAPKRRGMLPPMNNRPKLDPATDSIKEEAPVSPGGG